VRPYAQCLFTASASGGTEPYSYAWTVDGVPVGSGPAIYHTAGSSNFEIAVTVMDGENNGAGRSLPVSVDASAPECLDM
jgi:hypothetical protein